MYQKRKGQKTPNWPQRKGKPKGVQKQNKWSKHK